MATRTITEHIDDLDGATGQDVATVEFSLDRTTYEIDLSADNQGALRQLLAPYVQAGRKVTGKASATRTTSSNGSGPAKRDPEQTRAIREWARNNGYPVSDRGRIERGVEKAYNNDRSIGELQEHMATRGLVPVG